MNLEPRWNIAPTQRAPIVRVGEDGGREMVEARWGLVPFFWSKPLKEMKFSTFNAKSETAAKAASYREPLKRRRCLVPAIGFFEWTGPKGDKQPWFITVKDREPIAFAGLWDRATIEGETLESFTILTTAANEATRDIHARMPVILDPKDYAAWIDPDGTGAEALMTAPPAGIMQVDKANRAVGAVRHDGEWLLDPAADPQTRRLI